MLKLARNNTAKSLMLAAALCIGGTAMADADPTLAQVYSAAEAGHLDQAQQMMAQVLRDHPESAKAHYVSAELYAKQGRAAQARTELATAERLEPGLPFAKAQSVAALQNELGESSTAAARGNSGAVPLAVAPHAAFPWGLALMIFGGLAVLWMIMRRRSAAPVPLSYPQSPGAMGGVGGYGYGAPPAGGGMGSGIVGGLASGLAVGAGVVAGEEIAHHFLDGDRRGESDRGVLPVDNGLEERPGNGDMGGDDFGVSDAGSWDDSGGGGGDSDWS